MSAVTIIDYKMGNLRSIANAMRLVGADVRLARTGDELGRDMTLVVPRLQAFGSTPMEAAPSSAVLRRPVASEARACPTSSPAPRGSPAASAA